MTCVTTSLFTCVWRSRDVINDAIIFKSVHIISREILKCIKEKQKQQLVVTFK